MTTLREHSRNAAADLIKVLRLSAKEDDADGAAVLIEKAIKTVMREHDSKARRALEKAQASAEERLARLLSSSPAVIYSFRATGDFGPTFVSDNIAAVFGYATSQYMEDPNFWRDRVHADDLARVEEAIAKFFQNGVHTVEYRFRRKDGSYCWVNDEQHLVKGADGKPLEVVGSWSDITARKAAEEARAAAHAQLAQLLASSPAV
ncbi:MAG TPA: PAS domain-containing protein, partial [Candidatus Acidoferrum sp.]|nr:PAS domain-containing protein [Candidatus Acidoferrum sp.]